MNPGHDRPEELPQLEGERTTDSKKRAHLGGEVGDTFLDLASGAASPTTDQPHQQLRGQMRGPRRVQGT